MILKKCSQSSSNNDDTAKSIEDTMHITEAWHAGKHADELSLNVMSYIRAMETDVLRLEEHKKKSSPIPRNAGKRLH